MGASKGSGGGGGRGGGRKTGKSGSAGGSEPLPDLKGSEKQIKWAEQIRNDAIKDLRKAIEIEPPRDIADSKTVNMARDAFREVIKKDNADFWIRKKDLKPVHMADKNPLNASSREKALEIKKVNSLISWYADNV